MILQMSLTSGDGALRVLLQLARASEAGDPYGFRFEPQDYILPTAGGATPSARFEWTAEVLADLEAVRRPGRNPAVAQRLGERLRAFVQAAGWGEWEREIALAGTLLISAENSNCAGAQRYPDAWICGPIPRWQQLLQPPPGLEAVARCSLN